MSRRAVFLDRDGVLIQDINLLTRTDQMVVYDCVPAAIRRLKDAGWVLIVATNQTVVARGLASEQQVEALNFHLQSLLKHSFDGLYFCPHHPNATLLAYRQECECRKPRPGMLLRAARDLNIDLFASYMVGDRRSDIEAGYQAGCRTILLNAGMDVAPAIESSQPITARPDYVCSDLAAAADIILGK